MGEWNPQANARFLEALDRPAGPARTAYLNQVCDVDEDLKAQVVALLEANQHAREFLSAPALELRQTSVQAVGDDGPGSVIGPYKLLQEIGEGGMGVVYMAEQSQPVRRTVALKIIKPGMDSRQVVARFAAELQALALMDHPNIAKIFDAGSTQTGRPFFAMELVKGIPITEYCDERQLAPRQRLELFLPVCKAVQHAHQKGVIHRDLKPSNVMVASYDGQPVPKVIDFGVAKATGPKLTELTLFTEFGAVLGTLEYMSPEQAELNQLDVDTRSDIYSLGVLLYELLTGATPLGRDRKKNTSIMELLRMIREEEPPRPSTRLSTAEELPSIAARRGMEPAKLAGLVRGDLDWIVMKCLEKDRTRRYETANLLAMDIQRHMNNEPILACSPSATYKLRKFIRRNRSPVIAAAALFVVLCLGLAGTSHGLFRARAEALDARLAKDAATQDRDLANKARQQADHARLDERRLNFHLAFDRGLALCDQGQVGSGMLWLARALELAPRDEVAMERVIRANLTAWQRELHTLQAIYPYKQGASTGTISPDGTLVLTGAIDGAVQLWDRRTGMARGALRPHDDEVHEIAFSPDGASFLTASIDETARLWDTKSGQVIHEFPHGSAVWGALFTLDGRIITSDADGEVQVWDPKTGDLIDAWENTTHGSVHDIALSSDGKQILGACEYDGMVLLWDIQTQQVIAVSRSYRPRPDRSFYGTEPNCLSRYGWECLSLDVAPR